MSVESKIAALEAVGFPHIQAKAIVEAMSSEASLPQHTGAEGAPGGGIVRIYTPDNTTIPPGMGGVSQATWDSISFWNTRGITVVDLPENFSEINLQRSYLGLSSVELWCGLGADIFDYDVWHEIADPNDPCPYSTADPVETWAEWGLASNGGHAPIQLEPAGAWYRSNLYGDLGERLPASKWWQYISTPATATTSIIRMLTVEEFQALPRPEPV